MHDPEPEEVFLRYQVVAVQVAGGGDTPAATVVLDVQKVKWESQGDGVYRAHALMKYACPSCDQVHEIRHHLEAPVLLLRNTLQCRTCGGQLDSSEEAIEYSDMPDRGPLMEVNMKLMCKRCSSAHSQRFEMAVPDLTTLRGTSEVEVDVGESRVRRLVPPKQQRLRRFDVALSFSGTSRRYVAAVARSLYTNLGADRVFYDEYYAAELARPDLDTYLERIYRHDSHLIVVFVCEGYERSEWCGLEWRTVRDIVKSRSDTDVMFMRFTEVELPGLLSIDGWVNVGDKPPEVAASLIERRLHFEQSQIRERPRV